MLPVTALAILTLAVVAGANPAGPSHKYAFTPGVVLTVDFSKIVSPTHTFGVVVVAATVGNGH